MLLLELVIGSVELVPQSVGNRFAVSLINQNQECFLTREENEGNVARQQHHKGDLGDVGLPVSLAVVGGCADVEKHNGLDIGTEHSD